MSEKGKSSLFKNPKEMSDKEIRVTISSLDRRRMKIERQLIKLGKELIMREFRRQIEKHEKKKRKEERR